MNKSLSTHTHTHTYDMHVRGGGGGSFVQSPSINITHSPDQRPDADNTRASGEVKTTNKDPQYMSTDVFLADRQVSVRGS